MIDTSDGFDDVRNNVDEVLKLDADAKKVVAGFTTGATVTGAVPIPFADMPLLIGEQVVMMTSICVVYGIKVKKERLEMLAIQVIGAGGASVLGKTIATNVVKLIPGAGSVVGGAISATTAGVITFALGMAFIEICNEVELGKLSEKDMFSRETARKMKKIFKNEMKKRNEDDES